MENRGVIYNYDRARQQNDFSGLCFGKITPTDIDGLMEYQNKAWFLIEVKFGETQMKYGQRLAFERLIDDMEAVGKKAICLVAKHNTPIEEDIDTANCAVTEYRVGGKWTLMTGEVTVRQAIDMLLIKWKLNP